MSNHEKNSHEEGAVSGQGQEPAFKMPPSEQRNNSRDYYCTYGIQKIGTPHLVNAFSTSVKMGDLRENGDILLVDDLRGDALWGMHRIIQRSISSSRVQEIAQGFLSDADRPIKFFPALTVILIPLEDGRPSDSYLTEDGAFENISGVYASSLRGENLPPVLDEPAVLKWDKNKVQAVVVDGQHRVSALRKFYSSGGITAGQGNSIPTTIVVFENHPDLAVVPAARQLFIDINNTPRRVSEQKLIFIDDRNILRRLTASVLGSLPTSSNEEDIYQIISREGRFLGGLVGQKINKYLVGEDVSDDEQLRSFHRNHDRLLPWEITHIITLHESVIEDCILSGSGLLGSGASLFQLANIINSNSAQLIMGLGIASLSDLEEDRNDKIIDPLLAASYNDGEIKVFRTLCDLRSSYLKDLANLEDADEEEDEALAEKTELKRHFESQLKERRNFEFKISDVRELEGGELKKVKEFVVRAFKSLWFVRALELELENGSVGLSSSEIFKFIVFSKDHLDHVGELLNGRERSLALLNEMIRQDQSFEQKRQMFTDWIDKNYKDMRDNLIRKVVGQQLYFGWLIDSCADHDGVIIDDSRIQLDAIIKINRLGEAGFWHQASSIEFNICGCQISMNPLEGLLRTTNRILPGVTNARKGVSLLKIIDREAITRDKLGGIRVREYEGVIIAYGKRVYQRLLENGFSTDDICKYARDNITLENYLRNDGLEIKALRDASGENKSTEIRAVQKVLGGIALGEVVEVYRTKMLGLSA